MKGRFRYGILVLVICLVIVAVAVALAEAASYNRWSAFDYALQWYNKVNPAFRYFEELDCANFVSQCLLAGGWSEVGKYNYTSTYAWYYDGGSRPLYSNTWAVANEIRKFIVNSGRGRAVSVAHHPWSSYFQVGDVIQIDYERDNRWDHTMIVTRVRSGDNIWVTDHTGISREADNEFYKSLSYLINSKYPNAKFMGYHLYDSFQLAPKLQKENRLKVEIWGNIKK